MQGGTILLTLYQHKPAAYLVLLVAGLFTLTPAATVCGEELRTNDTTHPVSKPSGVLAQAANAAAAAADAANAAATAANAAAKAAEAAIKAIHSILPMPQNSETSPAKTAPAPPQLPVATGVEPLPVDNQTKDLKNDGHSSGVGDNTFAVSTEHSLPGLVGKFEIPVYVDSDGSFAKSLSGNQRIQQELVVPIGETTMDESIRAGRSFSRDNLVAIDRIEQAKAQTNQAFGLLLPSVSINASGGKETSTPSAALNPVSGKPISSETHNRYDLGLTVRQPLFSLSSYYDWRRYKVAEQARKENHRASDGDAFQATVNAYLSLVSSRLLADMARDYEMQLQDLLSYINKRVEAGAASISDMARVRARSQSALSSRLEQESAHTAAGIEFVRLTNVVPQLARLPEVEEIGASLVPKSLNDAVSMAMATNPDISALLAEIEASGINMNGAKSRYLPQIDMEYTNSYTQHALGDPSPAGQRDARYMLVLNWNLFSGGSDYYAHHERAVQRTELEHRLDDQRRRIIQSLSANYALLATTRERIATGYRVLESTSTAADAMSKRMLSGNQSLLDLLDVYNSYYQARTGLVNLHAQEMNTVSQLIRLTSGVPVPVAAKAAGQTTPAPVPQ